MARVDGQDLQAKPLDLGHMPGVILPQRKREQYLKLLGWRRYYWSRRLDGCGMGSPFHWFG
jgi:hypothetical protein